MAPTTRRRLLQLGGAAAAAVPGSALAGAKLDAPRRLKIHNLHTGEKLDAIYYEGGRYIADAMRAVNRLLRDHRTGDVHPMRPQLIDLMSSLSAKLETKRPFEIISGYRSPRTNARLHEASAGVATRSLHMEGMASDIRLPGVSLANVHRAALSLGRGGVGYYPSSDFVHVDVGAVRRWG